MSRTEGSRNGEFGANVNQREFEALCGILCTKEEICSFFNVSDDTLQRWCRQTYGTTFAKAMAAHSDRGRISLRRYQFELAKKNPTMAIWLGKQYLNQTDRQEMEIGGEGIVIRNDLPKGGL